MSNSILSLVISELKRDNEYHNALSELQQLKRYGFYFTVKKNCQISDNVREATKIIVSAAIQVDSLQKQASFNKDASFISKIMLKTLKITQKMLAGMLLANPIKISIAYNALHNVIKFLEKSSLSKK